MVCPVLPQQPAAPPLPALARQINHAHREARLAGQTMLDWARTAGGLLLAAKGRVRHGEWLDWLAENVEASERTCQAYMRVANRWEEIRSSAADLASLRDGLAVLGGEEEETDDDLAVLDAQLTALAGQEGAELEERAKARRAREMAEGEQAAWARAETRLKSALRCFRALGCDELLGLVEALLVRAREVRVGR